MKIEQKKWMPATSWQHIHAALEGKPAQLVLAFGDRFALSEAARYAELKKMYPQAHIIMASTSGNIIGTTLEDQSIITTAMAFEGPSTIEVQRVNIADVNESYRAGEYLGEHLNPLKLAHILLISDGHLVNGSKLIKGLLTKTPPHIAVTGGLAGDGTRFEKTIVGLDAPPTEGEIVVVGFYGVGLRFGMGSVGGWDPFGIERKITRSKDNILYELDGQCALELYKKYLGEEAQHLPGSALKFPLAIRPHRQTQPLVRTILSIDEKEKSMTFAGDLPEGWYAQLMKANFDRLVDGASQAANSSHEMLGNLPPDLALLISCVGRRIVLDQRTEDEIESVQDVLGKKATLAGFYSYGEIAPMLTNVGCELHNQTMTITTISERDN